MKNIVEKLRYLFPGKQFVVLLLNCAGLFVVSLFEMFGVAAILPIIQLAIGNPITGYLETISGIFNNASREELIVYLSILLVTSFVLKGVLSLAIKWWSSGFIAHQQSATSVTLLSAYMHDSYAHHRQRTTAQILRDINDAVGQTYSAFIAGTMAVIGEFFSIFILTIFLIVIMPGPALLAFIYFGLTAFLLQHFLRRVNAKQGRLQMESAIEAMNAALESIVGFRENRLHGMTDRNIFRYQQKRLKAVDAQRKSTFFTDLPKYLLEVIFVIGIALLLGFMTFQNGDDSAPYLLVFAGACVRILPSYTRLVGALGTVRVGASASDLVVDKIKEFTTGQDVKLIATEPDIEEFAVVNAHNKAVEISVENLSFNYPDSPRKVLQQISFSIPFGTSLALVGGSGSGKTTLVDLILGLFAPTDGTVTVNGADIQKNLSGWHQQVGYVPQNVFLGDSTVVEAIAFGLKPEEIDYDRVWECINITELRDVIDSLEHGIDTAIGEHGTRLSGGQRQRLGIARALYRNPSVLILDEATSALDNETEHKITQTINRLAKEITVIIVAHRLSTVRNVDQLLYLSGGRIMSQGTFSEVRAHNKEFARLVELGQLPD